MQHGKHMLLIAIEHGVLAAQLGHALLDGGVIAGVQRQVRHHQLQADAAGGLLGWQAAQQPRHLAEVALVQQVIGAGFDDVGSGFGIAGLHRMAHGLVEMPMGTEPAPGGGVQVRRAGIGLGLQATEQDLAQQWVQAIPGLLVMALDLGDEQVVAVQAGQLGEHPGDGMGLAQQGCAQRGAKAFADRHPGQQAQVVRRQAHQHFTLEVTGKGTGIAHLDPVEATALLGLQVHGKQLQPRDPAIGQLMQHRRIARVDAAQLLAQEAFRFIGAEAQVAQVEITDLAASTKACEDHRRGLPRTEHQVQPGGCVIEQPVQHLDNVRVLHMVQVVQHQHQLAPVAGNALHQGNDPMFQGQLAIVAPQQEPGLAHQRRVDFRQAGLQAMTEAFRVIVIGGQRQPGHIEMQCQQLAPPGQQRAGLAAPGRALDHHAALSASLHQTRKQALAGQQQARPAWRHDLGLDIGGISVGG
ncbi:hypothetical protein D3C77_236750 [compost metagenome]